jgi:Kef-type K+ transport system membrane component KefB
VFALFLGVALCVSAIPVIAKILTDMKLLHRDVSQLTLAAATIDDAAGWFLLSIVAAMASGGVSGQRVTLSLAALAGTIIFAIVVGRPLARALFALAARSGDQTGTVALTAALVILAAAGTQALGLEAVFGAFLCGVLISEYGKPSAASIAPLRIVVLGVLAPIFFATAGLRMDLAALARPDVAAMAVAMLAVAIIGKFAGAYLGARLSRMDSWEALALGAAMNARGVIEIIIAMTGLRLGVLSGEMFTIIVLIAVVTSVMAPPILRIAVRHLPITPQEDHRRERQAVDGVNPQPV